MTSTTISSFETELTNKLEFKASSKVSVDALLFKTFKFFDLYNNGYLQKSDFFKAIAKCGVVVQTGDLEHIFNYYDTHQDGKIRYKQFVQNLLFRDSQSNLQNKSAVSEKPQSRRAPNQNVQQDKMSQSNYSHTQKSSNQQVKNSPAQRMKNSKIQQLYSQCQTPGQIMDYIKKQIRNEGICGLLNLAIKLKTTDPNKTHSISGFKLHQILSFLNQQQIKRLIQQFNPSPNGQINYGSLIYTLRGSLQPQRKTLIDQTFEMLDQQRQGQFQIKRVIESYHAQNRDEFVRSIDQYCEFQGIDDGYFTDEDFKDFFQFISFCFVTNEEFRSFMLRGYYEQEAKSNKSQKSRSRQFDKESSQHRRQQFQGHHFEQPLVKQSISGGFKKNKEQHWDDQSPQGKLLSDYHVQQPRHQLVKQQQERSVSRSSARSNSHLIHSNLKEVQLIMLRIKKRLASKGTRGFLVFEKALKNADSDCDYFLNLDQFKRVIKEQRIDITNTESNIVFDVFDDKKQGLINFQDLVYTIKGETPANRQHLIERIWKKVSKGQQFTSFTILRQCINLRVHPQILNGKKYEDEILNEMRETILMIQDLNGKPRCQQISKDQFTQYVQNLSLTTPEDQLFESLAVNFWRIDPENKIEQQYAGSRKLFDPNHKGYLVDHHRYAVKGGTVTDNAPFGTFSGPTIYTTEHRRL